MSERMTIDELKSYLWQSAVLLRTNIDAGAYKQYIFPLMFFKRICDVYDEETEKAIAEYGEDIDLSYRLLKGGWQNWYIPYSIIHYKGQSTKKSDFRYVHVFYQAMLIFFRKHYSHLSIFFTLPVKCAIYFRASLALVDIIRKKLHLG